MGLVLTLVTLQKSEEQFLIKTKIIEISQNMILFNMKMISVSFATIGIRFLARALQFNPFQNQEGHCKHDPRTEEHIENVVSKKGYSTTAITEKGNLIVKEFVIALLESL